MKNKYISSNGTNGAYIIKKFTDFNPECNDRCSWEESEINEDLNEYWYIDSFGDLTFECGISNIPEGYTEYKEDIKPTEESGLSTLILGYITIELSDEIEIGRQVKLSKSITELVTQQTTELKKEIERMKREVSIARNLVGLSNMQDLKEKILEQTKEIEELKKQINR